MFHEVMVKDEVVAEGPQAQIEDHRPEVGHHQQAQDLPQGAVLCPRGRVHVRCEEVVVGHV